MFDSTSYNWSYGTHSTFEQLVEAKKSGCHLCTILWHDFTLHLRSAATGSIEYTLDRGYNGKFIMRFTTNGLTKRMHWYPLVGKVLYVIYFNTILMYLKANHC